MTLDLIPAAGTRSPAAAELLADGPRHRAARPPPGGVPRSRRCARRARRPLPAPRYRPGPRVGGRRHGEPAPTTAGASTAPAPACSSPRCPRARPCRRAPTRWLTRAWSGTGSCGPTSTRPPTPPRFPPSPSRARCPGCGSSPASRWCGARAPVATSRTSSTSPTSPSSTPTPSAAPKPSWSNRTTSSPSPAHPLRRRRHHPQPRHAERAAVPRPRSHDPPRLPLSRRPAVSHHARVRLPRRQAPRPARGGGAHRLGPLHDLLGAARRRDADLDRRRGAGLRPGVFAEDQPIIESQPPGVPLDRRAELARARRPARHRLPPGAPRRRRAGRSLRMTDARLHPRGPRTAGAAVADPGRDPRAPARRRRTVRRRRRAPRRTHRARAHRRGPAGRRARARPSHRRDRRARAGCGAEATSTCSGTLPRADVHRRPLPSRVHDARCRARLARLMRPPRHDDACSPTRCASPTCSAPRAWTWSAATTTPLRLFAQVTPDVPRRGRARASTART